MVILVNILVKWAILNSFYRPRLSGCMIVPHQRLVFCVIAFINIVLPKQAVLFSFNIYSLTKVAIAIVSDDIAEAIEIHFIAASSRFFSGFLGTIISAPGVSFGLFLKINPLVVAVFPFG
jgi:hypothetical protein